MVVRSCVACRTRREKGRLLRIVASEGRLIVDPVQAAGGRGAYVCRDETCVNRAVDRHLIEKGVGAKMTETAAESLREDALRYVVSGTGGSGPVLD